MQTEGILAPASIAGARERYADLGPAAQEVTRSVATAMDVSREEYDERVDRTVVGTAREALFGSLLEVHTAERAAFDEWLEDLERDPEVVIEGSGNVANIAWHDAVACETVLAATYQQEREAAVATLRRMAWNRCYRDPLVHAESI